MHVTHLSLADFRSYARVEVPLDPGVTAFVGPNGQGKTNLVEAIGYLATLGSHRVASDAPLVRMGADRAIIRAQVRQGERQQLVELELNPGKANRARINRSSQVRPRDVLGIVRTVLFAPEDLALVKGDPGERRRFLDELITARSPRMAGVRSDYERVLKQRNTLLKSAALARRHGGRSMDLSTLDVWDQHLARVGAELLAQRLDLIAAIQPLADKAYEQLAPGRRSGRPGVQAVRARRGPHARGPLRAADGGARRGAQAGDRAGRHPRRTASGRSASQTRSAARQGVRLARRVLVVRAGAAPGVVRPARAEGNEPVLVLDDVFAELDTRRRERLAELVAPGEQVLVTAAVDDDVPHVLAGTRYSVSDGAVERA